MKNKTLLKVGVTGGIGAGKTTVCEVFRSFGIPIYNADLMARQLMETDVHLIARITKEFGKQSYLRNQKLNRKFLSELTFKDKDKVDRLNQIVHPVVFDDFNNWVPQNLHSKYIIKEAALLFESGSYKELDAIILVYAPLNLRINRILLRDSNRSVEDIQHIINNQMSDTKKKKLAEYVIVNDDKQLVLPQIRKIHNDLLTMLSG